MVLAKIKAFDAAAVRADERVVAPVTARVPWSTELPVVVAPPETVRPVSAVPPPIVVEAYEVSPPLNWVRVEVALPARENGYEPPAPWSSASQPNVPPDQVRTLLEVQVARPEP